MRCRLLVSALFLGLASHVGRSAEPIRPDQFRSLYELIVPKKGEEAFRHVPWLTSLWTARQEAARQGKPIVAFLMSGDPLGCT
jgi:hypothetical protein